jgi:hypothetical protein
VFDILIMIYEIDALSNDNNIMFEIRMINVQRVVIGTLMLLL